MSEQWFWLSFCDAGKPTGSQFIGVSVVRGLDIADAAANAWALGCNPGGEVMGIPCQGAPPSGFGNRLLTREQCVEMMKIWTPDKPRVMTIAEYEEEQTS